jgi:vacuolar-type H+-ATPase subunit H
MVDQSPEIELSPLDQIRQSESEITRKIAAARESAVHSLDAARQEAARIVAQAREDGYREGQARYQEILEAAEAEAIHYVDLAQEDVRQLSQRGSQRMQLAIQQVVSLVIGSAEM